MSYSGQELFEAGLRDSTNKEKDEIVVEVQWGRQGRMRWLQ